MEQLYHVELMKIIKKSKTPHYFLWRNVLECFLKKIFVVFFKKGLKLNYNIYILYSKYIIIYNKFP